MDFLLEILFELILEGSMEICKNKTANVFLRLFAFLFLVLFFGGFFILFTFLGIQCFKKSFLGGSIVLFIELVLLILSVIKVYDYYLKYKSKK